MFAIGLHIASARRGGPWWPEGAVRAADFVNGRYMADGMEVPFAEAFAFSRETPGLMAVGAGQWITHDAGVLRRHAGLGALLEPATSNQSRGTADIGGPGWTPPAGLTRSGNATDGFVFTVGQSLVDLLRLEQYGYIDIPAHEPGFFAFDLHDSGMRGAAIWFSDVGYRADFSTDTGIANGTGENDVASMTALGGGWWRCRVRHRHTAVTQAWRIKLGSSRFDTSYQAGDFIRVRLPQVELGRFTTPVVNTSITQSTMRAADRLAATGGANLDVTVYFAGGASQNFPQLSGPLPAEELLNPLVTRAFWS